MSKKVCGSMELTWWLSVLLGCYNWVVSEQKFVLVVLKAGSLRSGCQHGQVRVLYGHRLLMVSSLGRKGTRDFLSPFCRAPPFNT